MLNEYLIIREGVTKLDFLGYMSPIRGGGVDPLPLKQLTNWNFFFPNHTQAQGPCDRAFDRMAKISI